MVRLDAVDLAVQPHPSASGLGALRVCRGSADRVAKRGADVRRAEHFSGEPLRRAGLRQRCAARPWRRRTSAHGKTIAVLQRDDRVAVRAYAAMSDIYDPQFVKAVFDRCSDRYITFSLICSFGFTERWRQQCVAAMPA